MKEILAAVDVALPLISPTDSGSFTPSSAATTTTTTQQQPAISLYVQGLPHLLDSAGLRTFFAKFGEVLPSTRVVRDRGYGFVDFKNKEDAEAALSAARSRSNPLAIDGLHIRVERAATDKSSEDLSLFSTERETESVSPFSRSSTLRRGSSMTSLSSAGKSLKSRSSFTTCPPSPGSSPSSVSTSPVVGTRGIRASPKAKVPAHQFPASFAVVAASKPSQCPSHDPVQSTEGNQTSSDDHQSIGSIPARDTEDVLCTSTSSSTSSSPLRLGVSSVDDQAKNDSANSGESEPFYQIEEREPKEGSIGSAASSPRKSGLNPNADIFVFKPLVAADPKPSPRTSGLGTFSRRLEECEPTTYPVQVLRVPWESSIEEIAHAFSELGHVHAIRMIEREESEEKEIPDLVKSGYLRWRIRVSFESEKDLVHAMQACLAQELLVTRTINDHATVLVGSFEEAPDFVETLESVSALGPVQSFEIVVFSKSCVVEFIDPISAINATTAPLILQGTQLAVFIQQSNDTHVERK